MAPDPAPPPALPLSDAPDAATGPARPPSGGPDADDAPDPIAAAFAPLRELAGVLMADGIARQQAAHAIGRLVADAEARIRATADAGPDARTQLAAAFRAGQQAAQPAPDRDPSWNFIDDGDESGIA